MYRIYPECGKNKSQKPRSNSRTVKNFPTVISELSIKVYEAIKLSLKVEQSHKTSLRGEGGIPIKERYGILSNECLFKTVAIN